MKSSAVVSHFEQARCKWPGASNYRTSDIKYLQQKDISMPIDESLKSAWAREVVSFSLVIFHIQICNSLLKDMFEEPWHNLERFWERKFLKVYIWTGHFSSALERHCLKTLAVIDPFQKRLERKHFVSYFVKLNCFSL